jgi:hypothetical protein
MAISLERVQTFAKIWILHYLIYYVIFNILLNASGIIFRRLPFTLEISGSIILSPLMGMLGIFDGLIIFIPIIISILLSQRLPIFRSYFYTCILCYTTIAVFIAVNNVCYVFKNSFTKVNTEIHPIIFILISLLFSTIFIFRVNKRIAIKKPH